MGSITTANGPSSLATNPQMLAHHHNLGDSLVHDLTSEMNPGSMYYSPYPDPNLSLPIMSYPYNSLTQESMDLTYMLATNMNMSLPNGLLVDEAGPSGAGRAPLMSSFSTILPDYNPQIQSSSLPMSQDHPEAQTSKMTSFQKSGHAHTMLPPIIHPDPNDPTSTFGTAVRLQIHSLHLI